MADRRIRTKALFAAGEPSIILKGDGSRQDVKPFEFLAGRMGVGLAEFANGSLGPALAIEEFDRVGRVDFVFGRGQLLWIHGSSLSDR